MGKFNCEMCSQCCRSVGKLVISCIATLDEADKTGQEVHPIVEEIASFPYDIDETGCCSQLDQGGNFCRVYDRRPDICNVATTYEKHWSQVMSEKDWHIQSKISCLKLQGKDKADGLNK